MSNPYSGPSGTLPEVPVPASVDVLSVDVRWDAGAQTALASRVGLAVAPLVRDRIPGRDHVVFANQPATPDGSISLGTSNDVAIIALSNMPRAVEAVSVMLFVQPRANAGKPALDVLQRLTATWRDERTNAHISDADGLLAAVPPTPAAQIARVNRLGSGWTISYAVRGFEAGLPGALLQMGISL